MTTYPVYFKLGDSLVFYRNLSADEARDHLFDSEEIALNIGPFRLDPKYEAPKFKDGRFLYMFEEKDA